MVFVVFNDMQSGVAKNDVSQLMILRYETV